MRHRLVHSVVKIDELNEIVVGGEKPWSGTYSRYGLLLLRVPSPFHSNLEDGYFLYELAADTE